MKAVHTNLFAKNGKFATTNSNFEKKSIISVMQNRIMSMYIIFQQVRTLPLANVGNTSQTGADKYICK